MKPEWIALTNTTLGVLMAGLNTSILLIALPPIFRGLGIDPLAPSNTSLLLWVLLGYPVVTTTLLVTVGRVSDIYGRVRLYTIGFAVFTSASALLTATWSTGTAGALEIIGFRLIQGLGAALAQLDANFVYWHFAITIFLVGIGMGLFSSPNTASIMNSVPEAERGVASGMRATLQNSGVVLSMILFFTVIILALAGSLPAALIRGLTAAGLTSAEASQIAALPPSATIFAAFLGYNPMQHILPPATLGGLAPALKAHLLARDFFPSMIGLPLMQGLRLAFYIAAGLSVVAAIASMFRGQQINRAPVTETGPRRAAELAEQEPCGDQISR